jgi:hypothetical protein
VAGLAVGARLARLASRSPLALLAPFARLYPPLHLSWSICIAVHRSSAELVGARARRHGGLRL